MPTPGQELSTIDFESMLGGPLIAVVHAQAQAAISTVDFIKTVGFHPAAGDQTPTSQAVGDPIYVDFTYFKEVAPYQPAIPARAANPSATPPDPGAAAVPEAAAQYQQQKLSVPILTLYPIPYLRIEDTTIDFKAKIDAVEFIKTDTSLKIDASLEAQAGWGWGSAKLKVSASYQRNTSQGQNTTRTYSMDVHIHAVQDEMPGGMQRMLSILEGTIQAQPLGAPAPQISSK
jgi:Protein of unknown function (DUF2589)